MGDYNYNGHNNNNNIAGGNKLASSSSSAIDADKIFVGGLSWQTTEESLRYHFEQYGPVVSVEVMRDRNTGDPRGFAFVVFKDIDTVDLVMKEARHEINHKIVDVKRAQARGVAPPSIHRNDAAAAAGDDASAEASHPQGGGGGGMGAQVENNKVFIGGIPPNVDRDELKRIFEAFAPVVDSIVMMDQQMQRSRGFGFVTFEQGSNGAQNAVAAQPLFIQGRRVEVKLATPKGDAQKRFPPAAAAATTHVGLRAGMGSSSSSGEFAGLAAAYGRSGWKAGYGTHAFGEGGWAVQGWEGGKTPERSGFSFDLLKTQKKDAPKERPTKKVRRE